MRCFRNTWGQLTTVRRVKGCGVIHDDATSASVSFPLPVTCLQVQTLVADDVSDYADAFVTVTCTACSDSHLVNAGTGSVVGGKQVDNSN
jgi:hypothetical protein